MWRFKRPRKWSDPKMYCSQGEISKILPFILTSVSKEWRTYLLLPSPCGCGATWPFWRYFPPQWKKCGENRAWWIAFWFELIFSWQKKQNKDGHGNRATQMFRSWGSNQQFERNSSYTMLPKIWNQWLMKCELQFWPWWVSVNSSCVKAKSTLQLPPRIVVVYFLECSNNKFI